MDSYGVRRKDTTKGPPLRVLSLDGGGVRGYSMLIIIQELMYRTFVEIEGRAPRRHEIPKPCDHFDLIVGTGTGGLIAIMLGRLRLDLEKCKELYVRMTRMVFETDKTIAGIPIRSTLFKASRLEDAIKQVVWEHTVYEREGNDSGEPDAVSPLSAAGTPRRHSSNASVLSFSARNPHGHAHVGRPVLSSRFGNGNASLYDARESRTKTVVTAMYKGSGRGAAPVLLRSYDSRREPPPEFNCKIWQAGRATCAIGLAFKPIQIGQSIFHDDAYGAFNPAPEALDEAVVNEWPGREVGVFVSVGTGKRPRGSDANQHIWYEGFFSDFADARRKLIAKIENCEKIHEYMVREHLVKRGVNVERYYRLNVEIGVGEFGMNEWNRLGEISTSTRRYMGREDEQRMIQGISSKLAKVHRAKLRIERGHYAVPELVKTTSTSNFEHPLAVELPGDVPPPGSSFGRASHGSHSPPYPPSRASYESGRGDSIHMMRPDSRHNHNYPSPQSSHELQATGGGGWYARASPHGPRAVSPASASHSASASVPASQEDRDRDDDDDDDRLHGAAPTPTEYRHACGADKIAITSADEQPLPQPRPLAHVSTTRIDAPFLMPDMPPPVPPKTPLGYRRARGGSAASATLQYPLDDDDDEGPPPVNMARKPEYLG